MGTTSKYNLPYQEIGDPPNGATLGQDLAEAVEDALLAPIAQLRATSAQSIPGNVVTAVTMGAADFDTHSGWSATSNPTRWTCPAGWAGIYEVSGGVSFVAGSGARVQCQLGRNGAVIIGSPGSTAQAGALPDNVVSRTVMVTLAVGDYVELFAHHPTTALSTTANSGSGETSVLRVRFVRPS